MKKLRLWNKLIVRVPLRTIKNLLWLIPIALGIVAIAVMTLATFHWYDASREQVEQARDYSVQIENERLKEDIIVQYSDDIRIEKLWSGKTRLTGVVTECDDGSLFTAQCSIDISRTVLNPTCGNVSLADVISSLEQQCRGNVQNGTLQEGN